jgi:hypothetical protein
MNTKELRASSAAELSRTNYQQSALCMNEAS